MPQQPISLNMRYSYTTHVNPIFATQPPRVRLTDEKVNKVNEFIGRLAKEKQKEEVHQRDGAAHAKRFYTGFACEAALEQFFGVDFMDTTVGESSKYRASDLLGIGLDVGVKGVRYENDKFHIINININKPQVICFLAPDQRQVVIMGYATVEVLRKYVDTRLVRDRNMADRKTGFYGYDKLIRFNSLDELRKLAQNN